MLHFLLHQACPTHSAELTLEQVLDEGQQVGRYVWLHLVLHEADPNRSVELALAQLQVARNEK